MARSLAALLGASLCAAPALSCTNFYVSRGATVDGATQLAYNADDVVIFGALDLRAAATHPPGASRAIWSWDSGAYVGAIPEVPATLNVVGNVNELGVIITEATFGGRGDLNGAGLPFQVRLA